MNRKHLLNAVRMADIGEHPEQEAFEAMRFDLVRPDGTVAISDCTAREALHFTSGKLTFLMIAPRD